MLDPLTGYPALLKEIKERIRSAQYEALKAVNKELISLYWDIGQMIVERQKGNTWGKSIVKRLAKDLQAEFPGMGGFSEQNLWFMRQLYCSYRDNQRLQPLVREIGWTHNLIILTRCKDDLEREFYIRMTKSHGWSKSALVRQIELQTYETTMISQTNFDKALPKNLRVRQSSPSRTSTRSTFWKWVTKG